MWRLLRKNSPFSKHRNGLGTNKHLDMCSYGARNQDGMNWTSSSQNFLLLNIINYPEDGGSRFPPKGKTTYHILLFFNPED
jgi:hypothetical protein